MPANYRTVRKKPMYKSWKIGGKLNHLARRKKLVNDSGIPQHEIEHIARCILPDIIALYESEQSQREFQEWKAQREAEAQERTVQKDHT